MIGEVGLTDIWKKVDRNEQHIINADNDDIHDWRHETERIARHAPAGDGDHCSRWVSRAKGLRMGR